LDDGSLESRVEFLLSVIELLFLSVNGRGATTQIVSKLAAFRRGWVSLSQDFRGKRSSPANILIPLERQLTALQHCR